MSEQWVVTISADAEVTRPEPESSDRDDNNIEKEDSE